MRLRVNDLWTPKDRLPTGRVLRMIAARCGLLWDMPDIADRVRIGYNSRLRTTLGRAVLDDGRVELNTRLLRKHPRQLIATLVHELAHLAAYHRYGDAGHGRAWKTLMHAVALRPRVTHDLPTAQLRRARRQYLYLHRCGECGQTFIARSVRRNYYCTTCGPEMKWDIWRAPNTAEGRKHLKSMQTPQGANR